MTVPKRIADDATKGAMAGVLNELFQDMYNKRWQIYRMNFLRGLFFGLGGAIGGTLVIFILVWLLSLFDQLPFIGNFIETIKDSLNAPAS